MANAATIVHVAHLDSVFIDGDFNGLDSELRSNRMSLLLDYGVVSIESLAKSDKVWLYFTERLTVAESLPKRQLDHLRSALSQYT